MQINFVDIRISIKEGNGLNRPIKMQHRKTQEEFTLTLHAVTIGEAKEMFDVGRFIPLDDCSKEAQRKNVLQLCALCVQCKTGLFSGV